MASSSCFCSRSFPAKPFRSRIEAKWGSTKLPTSTRLWTSLPVKELNWSPLVPKVCNKSIIVWIMTPRLRKWSKVFLWCQEKKMMWMKRITLCISFEKRIFSNFLQAMYYFWSNQISKAWVKGLHFPKKTSFIGHRPQMLFCGFKKLKKVVDSFLLFFHRKCCTTIAN